MSRLLAFLLVGGVILLPLPFAGIVDWAWSSYSIHIGVTLLTALFAHDPADVGLAARRLAVPLGLALAFCLYVLWQTLSFGADSWRHPLWAAAADALPGRPVVNSVALDASVTLDALTRFLSYLGTFWLAFLSARTSDGAMAMLKWVVVGITAYAVYGLMEYALDGNASILWFERTAYVSDVTSTFVNRNSFATYAGLGVIASLGWLIHAATDIRVPVADWRLKVVSVIEQGVPRLMVPLLAWLLLMAALMLTHSRAGLFSTVGSIVILVGLLSSRHRMRQGLVPLLVAILICSSFIVGLSNDTLKRLDAMTWSEGRLEAYSIMLEAIAARPCTGFGYGNFEQAFGLFRGALVTGYFDRGHNDYFELALGVGLPATAVLLAAIGWVAGRCVVGVLTRRRNIVFPAVAAGAITLVGLHAAVDFSLQMPAVAATFAFLLGIGTAQAWRANSTSSI